MRGRVAEGVSFRILALDGGGIKGAFTASVLVTLSKQLKEPITDRFDLIAGTSTGGILAIGLGMGMDADNMLKFFPRARSDYISDHALPPPLAEGASAFRQAEALAGRFISGIEVGLFS